MSKTDSGPSGRLLLPVHQICASLPAAKVHAIKLFPFVSDLSNKRNLGEYYGDQFLESQTLKPHRKVLKEIAHPRIITVAIHHLVPKMRTIVSQFIFYIRQLRVKIVLPVTLRCP